MRALLRGRGEMLVALLVMASGLVVAGVTAPSAPGAAMTAVTTDTTNSRTPGVRFRLVTAQSAWRAPDAQGDRTRWRSSSPLLLLLPATGSSLDHYQPFLATAMSSGYPVLALDHGAPGRLRPALARLAEDDPTGGWARFLDRDTVRWSEVVLVGDAKGGAEALKIAQQRPVRGVLLFGRGARALAEAAPLPTRSVSASERGLLDDRGEPDWQQRVLDRIP